MDPFEAFAEEANAGFPHLSRIPATNVIRFLDYYGAQTEVARSRLGSQAAEMAEFILRGARGERPSRARFDRMWADMRPPGPWSGGLRYLGVKFLADVPREFGSMEAWLAPCSGLARTPRADLLPDPASVVPAKAPLLRKLVKKALDERGYEARACAGSLRFQRPDGVQVDCDFGSRMGQLRWQASSNATRDTQGMEHLAFISCEMLWGPQSDWDYLTEENAPRCVAFLPELIDENFRIAGVA